MISATDSLNFDNIYFHDNFNSTRISIRNKGETPMRILGCDVGTGNLGGVIVSTSDSKQGKKEIRRVKDAFFKIDVSNVIGGAESSFGENVLKQAGANYIKIDGALYVLGDDAFKFANLFHSECLRPMAKGVLNPSQPMSAVMLKELIRGIIGECSCKEDVLYFCVPAAPVDGEFNIIYHTDMLKSIFLSLGYENVGVMNEGLAVIFSELQSEAYTGVGLSAGSGMVNVCYAFMGIPVFSFSIPRCGDWIDENVATATNDTKAAVQAVKEAGVDLTSPKGNAETAIAIYYNAMLENIVRQFKGIYERTPKKDLPNISAPLTLAVAGGTSLAGGFIDRLTPMVTSKTFPVPISRVVHAKEPLMAIASGLCTAALISKKK